MHAHKLDKQSTLANTPPHPTPCPGALGGRLDHTLANVNALLLNPHLNIILYGMGTLARLLRPGESIIHPDPSREGPTCGLVPIRGPTRAHTQGLKYNLSGQEMKFGGLLSTSNAIVGEEVRV